MPLSKLRLEMHKEYLKQKALNNPSNIKENNIEEIKLTKAQQKKIKSFNDDLLSIKNNIKTQHDKEEIKHLKAYFKTVQSKKNEYLKSIDNVNQPIPEPEPKPKPKPIKNTPQQKKKYKEILANPKIREDSKDAFKRFNHNGEKIMDIEDLNGWEAYELWAIDAFNDEEPPPKKTLTTQLAPKPKVAKPKNIMKGRSDLDGNKITTEFNIKKGLQPKVKRALKKSVIAELENKMSGTGLRGRTISLSSSDSD
jgi:hypothetical protein